MENQNTNRESQLPSPQPEIQKQKETFDDSSLPKKEILSECTDYGTFKIILEKKVLPESLVKDLFRTLESIDASVLSAYLNDERNKEQDQSKNVWSLFFAHETFSSLPYPQPFP